MSVSNLPNRLFTHTFKRLSPYVKNKASVSYFTLTLSLLTLSFFGLFAIRPTIITAVSLVKSVADLKALDLEYENKISSLVRAQSEYEQIREVLPLIDAAIPVTSNFSKLALKLEDFAQSSNILINQLQIDNVPISKQSQLSNKLQKFNFNLVATGDYPSISSYLQHLLNWQRIITIESLEFDLENVGTTGGILRLTLKGNTYYEP